MYLDFAATNPISKIWIDSIIESNSKYLYGNPGSYHKAGFDALDMMENSTTHILNNIFDTPEISKKYSICYNSGSTESINQFFNMYYQKDIAENTKTLFIYENVAHKAILKNVKKYFPNDCFELDFYLSIDDNLTNFKETLNNIKIANGKHYDNCVLVLTSVNNEVGGIWTPKIIDNINEIWNKYKEKSPLMWNKREITVFLDHTQGFMKHNENLDKVDAFCFSAHKIGGMKGFGGLIYNTEKLSDDLQKYPLIVGGYEIRGGTKDPISVKALEKLVNDKYIKHSISEKYVKMLYTLITDTLYDISKEYKIPISFNHSSSLFEGHSPYIINTSFIGIEGESLMSTLMDDCISTGSACNSSELKTSHVLTGLGIKKLNANCAFRISLSDTVDKDELIDFLDNRFKPAIKFLARMRTRHEEE